MDLVRRLVPDDAPAFREIRLEALALHPEAFGADLAAEQARSAAGFAERLAEGCIFGGFVDGRLDATAGLLVPPSAKQRHKATLWGVYVREARQGGTLAQALLTAVLAHAAGQVEQVQLSVAATNLRAVRFYRRLGFETYGTEPRALKIDGRYIDELLMVKVLAP
ncbi:GNAT family N-acetyltransferase [Azospirillum picis]|uniref:Ribosomal protein S18 acetylase RimI-like enzyme n=1 Tax=Azospirillum picis TaxID=488438 RepID=A0ABU0MT19_9PROT|nr:GNAT family N-acetyltransferase [Azospirillum picis]MBP2302713.1 ribosomal protein S18 acetylase RimI-like enzyme [Azospirillum picis]MDQ0536464.1 ribosomal protein S18 acetylase RimI-like enzyme [Azospirillum picis]